MKCKYKESCGYDFCLEEDCAGYKAVPETNADKIRAMSDEEMAKYFSTEFPWESCYSFNIMLGWLQQPEKEDTE